MAYSQKEKGILWLAEKFFQAAIAISSQYLIDGGRLKAICRYYYGKFLLDKCKYLSIKLSVTDPLIS